MTEEQVAPTHKLATRAELAEAGLTKRNQAFMWDVQTLATENQVSAGLLADIQAQLLAGQQTGKTAKQLFTSPEMAVGKQKPKQDQAVNPRQAQQQATQAMYLKHSFWELALDNALVFFALFSATFGLMLLFMGDQVQGGTTQNTGSLGITAMTLTAVSGGLLFAAWAKSIVKTYAGKAMGALAKLLMTLGLFGLWFGLYMAFAYLPKAINPILPGWLYLLLAVAAYFGFRKFREKTGIEGGFLGANRAK